MAIGGLDIGSTGAKITVLSYSGILLYRRYYEYPVMRSTTAHLIDAEVIWETVKVLLHGAAKAVPKLSAVGVTSFGESFVLLDKNGEVLLPTMLYTDPRGGKETDTLKNILGKERICEIAGCTPHSMYSLPKLMWIKSNKKESYAATKYVCLIGDFIVFKLTGNRIIDYSLAARTMAFDIHDLCWSQEILVAAGVDPLLFSHPVPSGTDTGTILPELARELGLNEALHVVICGHDQMAAAIGSNAIRPGQATNGTGTVECITPVFSSIPEGRYLQDNNYSIIPFPYKDSYCLYAFSYTGGALVRWFVDTLAGHAKFVAKNKGISVYDLLESGMLDEPTGILVLPHFAGAATPYMDIDSQGAFAGLNLTHTTSDVYRAVLEGIVYESALNLEKLAEGGIHIDVINATGGCAKSRLWLQMKADILGVPVRRMGIDEAGTVGSVMLTGVALGWYSSHDQVAEVLIKAIEEFRPRREMHEKYMKHYDRYRKMYEAVRPLY